MLGELKIYSMLPLMKFRCKTRTIIKDVGQIINISNID